MKARGATYLSNWAGVADGRDRSVEPTDWIVEPCKVLQSNQPYEWRRAVETLAVLPEGWNDSEDLFPSEFKHTGELTYRAEILCLAWTHESSELRELALQLIKADDECLAWMRDETGSFVDDPFLSTIYELFTVAQDDAGIDYDEAVDWLGEAVSDPELHSFD